MAAINKVLVDGVRPAATSVQTLYTSPANGAGTRIIALNVANGSGGTQSYDMWIVENGGSADDSNLVIPTRAISTLLTDVPSEVSNQLIPAGGTLQAQVTTADTLSFRATGIEFS